MPSRRIFPALLWAAALACGTGNLPSGEGFDGGSNGYALTIIGEADLLLHPAEQRTVQVLLTQDHFGPVANGSVHFECENADPRYVRLGAADVQTDAQGIAMLSVSTGDASPAGASYKLVVSTPRVGAEPVAFTVQVVDVRRALRIVSGPGIAAAADGAKAVVTLGVSGTVVLKVRELDEATGSPVAGDAIRFSLPGSGSSHWRGTFDRSIVVRTGASGDAQAVLLAAAFEEPAFPILARSESGGAAVGFTLVVQSGRGASCSASNQCGPGQACTGDPPHCQDVGGPRCEPVCAAVCGAGSHCVPGPACGPGSCVANAQAPDVTGLWLTQHAFRLRDALPAPVKMLADALRLIDQAVQGKLSIPGLADWLDSIIRTLAQRLLHQYLPGWARMVVAIGDDLFTLLSEFRAEGSMRIARTPGPAQLEGTEVWTRLVFYWLPLCGDAIGGSPAQPPDCARIELLTTDAPAPGGGARCRGKPLPAVKIQLTPFTAQLSPGRAYALHVDRRHAKLRMGTIILVLLDELLGVTTPYHCIEEITDCSVGRGKCPLVDCHRFGRDAQRATGRLVPAAIVEAACAGAVRSAGAAVTQILAEVWTPALDTLAFEGEASVSGSAGQSWCDPHGAPDTCAAQLGSATYDVLLRQDPQHRDGAWQGAFLSSQGKNVPGGWEAVRP